MIRKTKLRDPERTKDTILHAAVSEFSGKGLGGARVDAIAKRARVNKRMLYHYFGNKSQLFVAVLEHMYEEIRTKESALHLEKLDPVAGMKRLIEFSFNYYIDHPHFIPLLNSENLHRASHLKRSSSVRKLPSNAPSFTSPLSRSANGIVYTALAPISSPKNHSRSCAYDSRSGSPSLLRVKLGTETPNFLRSRILSRSLSLTFDISCL